MLAVNRSEIIQMLVSPDREGETEEKKKHIMECHSFVFIIFSFGLFVFVFCVSLLRVQSVVM